MERSARTPLNVTCRRARALAHPLSTASGQHPSKRIVVSCAKAAREGEGCSLPRRLWMSERFIGSVRQWRPRGQGFP